MADPSSVTELEHKFKVRTVFTFGVFCCVTIILIVVLGFYYIDRMIAHSSAYESPVNYMKFIEADPTAIDVVHASLEQDGLSMRNKRGLSALFMRNYVYFLALITGATISLLGSIFVLARVDGGNFTSEAEGATMRWNITSTSPGLIALLIGAIIIVYTVNINSTPISVQDAPLYVKSNGWVSSQPANGADGDFEARRERALENLRGTQKVQ